MKNIILGLFAALVFSTTAHADTWVTVSDMSALQWQMAPNGVVYFRNMNSFNATVEPCCYSYWLDTTTAAGKSTWAVFLTKMSLKQQLIIQVPTPPMHGEIGHYGVW